jgi:hypothetical protein
MVGTENHFGIISVVAESNVLYRDHPAMIVAASGVAATSRLALDWGCAHAI